MRDYAITLKLNDLICGDPKSRVKICVQKYTVDADYLTMNYLDMTLYLRLFINKEYSLKVNKDMIDEWGITEQEIWDIARENTEKDLTVENIMDVIGLDIDNASQYPLVFTNKDRIFGAVNIYFIEKIRKVAKELDEDLYLLPSSVHEILAVPCRYIEDESDLKSMVTELNKISSIVPKEDVLSNNVYKYSLKYDNVSII